MIKIFFSYCHADEELRDELEKSLAMLKRQGQISSFHDRRILSGDDFDNAIDTNMSDADITLFLVSRDFLASDYIMNTEMKLAEERHARGETHIIPIILRPCEWSEVPLFAKLLGGTTDNKAVTKYADLDDAFLDISKRIRAVVKELHGGHSMPAAIVKPVPTLPPARNTPSQVRRSSNLSVKKTFSDHDKDEFLDAAYEFIKSYFEGSLNELCERHPEFSHRLKAMDNTSFTATLYKGGKTASACTIFQGGSFGKGIAYSSGETSSRNSINGQIRVDHDDQKLFLSDSMFSAFSQGNKDKKLTFEGGAEVFWSNFIRPIQGGY